MIAALFALSGAALVVVARSRGLFGREGIRPRLFAGLALWGVAITAFMLAMEQPGFDPDQFGLANFGWRQLGYGLLFGVLGLLSFPVYILLAKKLGWAPANTQSLEVIAGASLPQRLFMLVTAAGAEELIFRAVGIGAMMAAGFPHLTAVGLPLLVFVLLHRSSWGLAHLTFVTVAGVLLTAAFVLGGLWAAILAHLIVDAPMMLAGKAIARQASANKHQNNESA